MSASPQLSKTPGPAVERRRSPRRSIVEEQIVAVTLDGDNGGLVLDLAENGLAVQAVTPLQPGKTTEMAFVLGEKRVPIRAHGVVRWAEPSGRAGIRLLAFSEGSTADIRAALLQPPATPATAERPAPPIAPRFDPDALEKELTGLDRERALARIAERTRELASASGIAIALGTREQMVCRASAGAAPSLGARLQSESGLSGECVRTGVLVRCDDTQADARVDAEVCRQLDLRSAVLLPILESGELRGVLEVFSSRPQAFAADDIRRFERVVGLVAKVLREPILRPPPIVPVTAAAVEPAMPPPAAGPALRVKEPAVVAEVVAGPAKLLSSPWTLRSPGLRIGAAVGSAVLLTLASWAVLRHRPATPVAVAATVPAPPAAVPVEATPPPEPVVAAQPAKPEAAKSGKETKVGTTAEKRPAATEEEEVVIRKLAPATPPPQPDPVAPPAVTLASGSLPNLAVPAATPARPVGGTVVAGKLVHRVEPVYPELARKAHIGGTVVLNAVVRPDGKIGAVQVVHGNPLLARAAVDAVRQWRYEPARLNGTAVQTQANIRLNFAPNSPPGR